MEEVFIFILRVLAYIAIGAIASFYFYSIKKKDLFGKFWGGLFAGIVGALIGALLLDTITKFIIVIVLPYLVQKNYVNINFLAAFIGAFTFVFILKKISHDRNREEE